MLTSTGTAGLQCQHPQSNQHPPKFFCHYLAYPERAQRSGGGGIPNTEDWNLSPDQPNRLPGLGVGLSGRTFAQHAQGSWGR